MPSGPTWRRPANSGVSAGHPKSHNSRRLEDLLPFTSDVRVRCLRGSVSKVCLRLNCNRVAVAYLDVFMLTDCRRAFS